MSYFRKTEAAKHFFQQMRGNGKWLILINADPDAIASAMALRRILEYRGNGAVDIARVNDIARPDNLSMIRYTRPGMRWFQPDMSAIYEHFALVDSQPSHHPSFAGIDFSLIVDHHPPATDEVEGCFMEIKPEYGASSTIFTEYLYNLDIRIGTRLATALQFGIRTDTCNFQRHTCEVDMRAYQYLSKFADQQMLIRIMQSELHLDWLPHVAAAIAKRRELGGGHLVTLGAVDSPDILVLIADFLMRVYEVRWVIVAGRYKDNVVMIFRGDGISKDMGRLAHSRFNALGSAGGHKAMARAEFPVSAVKGRSLYAFIAGILMPVKPKTRKGGTKSRRV